MKCEQAKEALFGASSLWERAALRLHLLRCKDCRSSAKQTVSFDIALSRLPRFTPSNDLLSKVLKIPTTTSEVVIQKKERKHMKRFAYAVAFLVAIIIFGGGLLSRRSQPSAANLLISAAQAMETADTIHMRGHGSKASPEGTVMSEDSFEEWCSSEGSRMNTYDPQGNLKIAWVYNSRLGIAWYFDRDMPWFPQGVVTIYHATPAEAEMANLLKRQRENYLNLQQEFTQEGQWGNTVTSRQTKKDGKPVTVVDIEVKKPSGETLVIKEYEIDPVTGRLLSSRFYDAFTEGRPLLGYRDVIAYGEQMSSSLFEFKAPAGAIQIEGRVNRYPEGIDLPNAYFIGYGLKSDETWHASAYASSGTNKPYLAIDGNKDTNWTGHGKYHKQEPGMWFQVAFEKPVSASRMTIHHSADFGLGPFELPSGASDEVPRTKGAGMSSGPLFTTGNNWPRGLQVSITSDGHTWEDVPTGSAAADRPACALFGSTRQILGVRLTITKQSDEAPWDITEIRIYE